VIRDFRATACTGVYTDHNCRHVCQSFLYAPLEKSTYVPTYCGNTQACISNDLSTTRSTTGASYTMLVISAGYFLHDAVTCIRNYEDWGFAYLVHAISCCTLYRCCPNPCGSSMQTPVRVRSELGRVSRMKLGPGTASILMSAQAGRVSVVTTPCACVDAATERRQASCITSERLSCYGSAPRLSVRHYRFVHVQKRAAPFLLR